jgi:hypothetical protein
VLDTVLVCEVAFFQLALQQLDCIEDRRQEEVEEVSV